MIKASPRRAFLKSLTLAPLLPAALTQTAPSTSPAPSPAPSPSPSPDALRPVADALAEVSRLRYGAHWEPGDAEEVRRNILDALRSAERLRAVKLTNADEPVATFQARPPPTTTEASAPSAPRRPRR